MKHEHLPPTWLATVRIYLATPDPKKYASEFESCAKLADLHNEQQISNLTALFCLGAAGYNKDDAYDILADAGFDPHKSAPIKYLTVAKLLTMVRKHHA